MELPLHQHRSSGQEQRTLHPLLNKLSSHPASVVLTPPEPSPVTHCCVEVSVWLGAASSSGAVCASLGEPSSAPPSGEVAKGCGVCEFPQVATIAKTPKAAGTIDRI